MGNPHGKDRNPMTCCTLPDLERLASGALAEDDSSVIEAHLLGCPACSERFTEVSENVRFISQLASDLGRKGKADGANATPPVAVGSYEIVREIGRGGMGIVYQAIQRDPQRPVAVKVLNERASNDPDLTESFRREGRALAMLSHPGIATIYEAGCTMAGRPYLAMEFIDGVPFCRFARENHLSIEERLRLFMQVADAVSAAHQRGILHLDLKPGNVLVRADRTIRILDFGLSRFATDGAASPIRLFGTLAYMSPEQSRGSVESLDVRSDIYSLGVVLYELLTGQLPYAIDDGDIAASVSRIASMPPAPLRMHDARIHRDVEAIVLKLLSKDQSDRYASASAIREDLQRYLARQPVTARSQTLSYVLGRLFARHRVRLTLAAIGAIMLLVFTVALGLMSVQLDTERQAAIAARDDAEMRLADTVQQAGYLMNTLVQRLAEVDGTEEMRFTIAREVHDIFAELAPHYPEHLPVQKRYWESLRLLAGQYAARGDREIARELLGESHHLVARAAKSNPADRDVQFQYAYSLRHLAGLEPEPAAARDRLEASIEILGDLVEAVPESALYHRELGSSLLHLSNHPMDDAEQRAVLELAAKHYAEAQRIEPEGGTAGSEVASVQARLDSLERADDEDGE